MRTLTRRLLALLLALLLLPLSPAAQAEDAGDGLRIAELMYKNKALLRDADGDFSDWIELENASSRPVALAGWTLRDRADRPGWELPVRTLQPGERLLVFADGKDRRDTELHTNFSLSEGETLQLYAPDGSLADKALCAGARADASLLRQGDGFVECLFPTPGYYETAAGYAAWQESCRPAGPLIISEVSVSEQRARFGEYYGSCDWVELENISGEDLSLEGWTLADGGASCVLPKKTVRAGSRVLIRCSKTSAASSGFSDFGTGFSLDAGSEQLYLRAPDGELVDWAALRGIPLGASFGRLPDRGGWFFFASPTPGRENEEGVRRVSAAPVCAERDGVFEGVESVSATLSAAGEIRYTLDGTLPDAESPLYTEPLRFTETAVLRAVAFERDALPSRALSLSFILNEGHTMPVVSLVADSSYKFRSMYENRGVSGLVTGNVAFYEEGGGFSLPCCLKLNGETSRVLQKKNLSLRFREVLGAEALDYDCFGGGVTHFTNLLLRSGQNYSGAVMRNELGCALADAATDAVFVQRFRYTVLYLNGKYAGIYALMEKANEQMAADTMGVSRDSVRVVEASVGQNDELFREVVGPILREDMRKEENYRAVCEKLDIDSLIDWTIIEGWCCNKDLQSGNLRYVRSTENDGKWRLMLYDLDATFGGAETCFDLLTSYSLEGRQIGQMLRELLKSESFRARFLERAAELLNGPLSDAALLDEIARLEAILAPEIPRNHAMLGLDSARWPKYVSALRALCDAPGWAQTCVDTLCRLLKVRAEERAQYFGVSG